MSRPAAPSTRRRSMRHPAFDYSEPGPYFVTICVKDRLHVLGDIEEGEMALSLSGQLIESCLGGLEDRFPTILVDCFVVMPNHIHAVIVLGAREPDLSVGGAMNRAATVSVGGQGDPKLGDVVRTFKAVSAKSVRETVPSFAWQSDYHDRIIRNDREFATIRDYVQHNPVRWGVDTFNALPETAPLPRSSHP